jgi:hypothetical protein
MKFYYEVGQSDMSGSSKVCPIPGIAPLTECRLRVLFFVSYILFAREGAQLKTYFCKVKVPLPVDCQMVLWLSGPVVVDL